MTNKPMLSVDRELLERIAGTYVGGKHRDGVSALQELRALLDKPAYPDRLCHADHSAHPYICGCINGDDEAQRRFDEHHRKVAQHQGEPVAYTTAGMLEIARRLPLTGRIGAKATKDERWNIPLFLGQGEQPAPVAVVMPGRKCPSEYRDATYTQTCMASEYNRALDDVARLNGVKP